MEVHVQIQGVAESLNERDAATLNSGGAKLGEDHTVQVSIWVSITLGL